MAMANPRRMWRCRKLRGPDRATAMKVAISSQPIGFRSRYITYRVRTTVTTTNTVRRTARTDAFTNETLASEPDAAARPTRIDAYGRSRSPPNPRAARLPPGGHRRHRGGRGGRRPGARHA